MKVLLLAGTAEARELSHRLAAQPGVDIVVSLAGRTSRAASHGGTVRVGGFGGPDGLERELRRTGVDVVVDATHPFARAMPRHAAEAAGRCGIPRLRLLRPAWQPAPGDRWIRVEDATAAASALRGLGATTALLTVGGTDLAAFAEVDGVRFVVRTIERHDLDDFADALAVEARGPFDVDDELALLARHDVEVVVTKNSGGDDAKLVAARRAGIPVVVIDRPPPVEGPTVPDVEAALRWIDGQRG